MQSYDLEATQVKQFLKEKQAKRAGIQLPPGLRPFLGEIEGTFREAGVESVILAGSCYGACDIVDVQAKRLGCDVLVHYGHADMGLTTPLPTLYVEASMKVDPRSAVRKVLGQLEFNPIGLMTTVQHIRYLDGVAELLRLEGLDPVIGNPGGRVKYPGQVLGCDLSCAASVAREVDGFLYIGTGKFHPLGVAIETGKPVLAVNPVTETLEKVDAAQDFVRRRKALISRAAGGKKFGVIVSTKPGQSRFKLAANVMNELRDAGFVSHLLVVDEIQPEKLNDFGLDCFVCTACPRIAIDDADRFEVPILTPFEAKVMLGKVKLEPYQLDLMGENF
jgi:2-(3-amino-3-carboxypropyl)histidine synthase